MTTMFNIYDAKAHLSRLVERAAAGEEIIIAKAGRPRAKLVPLTPKAKQRKPGSLRGKYVIPDDFDEPLPKEVLDGFE
jgi:prevent-host-death family protein